MGMLRTAVVILAMAVGPAVYAGKIPVPADISVHLTAQPDTDLTPGEPIVFSLTVVNHGPEPVDRLLIYSSDFYDQFDLGFGSTDCQGIAIIIADKITTFHYNIVWYPTDQGILSVGESRTCHITLALSDQAPQNWPFSFGVAYFYEDINPANNVSTVILRRGGVTPVAVRTLSLHFLLLLAAALASIAWYAFGRRRISGRPSG